MWLADNANMVTSPWGGTHPAYSTSVMIRMYDFISRDFEALSQNVT